MVDSIRNKISDMIGIQIFDRCESNIRQYVGAFHIQYIADRKLTGYKIPFEKI